MPDHILAHWNAQADAHGTEASASWADQHAIALEVATIARHLPAGSTVLDVGCANGHATLQQIERQPARLVGVDFSPAMIAQARRNAATQPASGTQVAFEVGDVRALPFDAASFDVVYTTRTLINLPTWDEQLAGVRECLRVCRPGGTVLLSEAFWEPLCQLNALRLLVKLPPLVEHDFNRYLKAARLADWLRAEGLAFEVDEFSSLYYLGSRVLRELVTDAAAWPGYSNPINADFHALEMRYSGGGFGVQQAWIIRKPAGA